MSVSIKPEDVKVHRSIASIFNLSDDTGTHYLTSFALLGLGTSYSPSVRGFTFCHEEPDYITCPFVIKRTTDVDFVVGALKVFGDQAFFHGISAPVVKSFKDSPNSVVPQTIWTSIKVSSDTLLTVEELADTETAKLKTNFDMILKGTTVFVGAGIKDIKSLEKWSERGFSMNFKAVLTAREKRLCKQNKERGQVSRDNDENTGGAAEAKEVAAGLRKNLLSWAKYYDVPFLDRFIVVAEGKRDEAEAAINRMPKHKEELLDALQEYCLMLDNMSQEISCATTPFKAILEKLA